MKRKVNSENIKKTNETKKVRRKNFMDKELEKVKGGSDIDYDIELDEAFDDVLGQDIFEIRSTKKEMEVNINKKCHPFFTGKLELVKKGGRIDRFNERYGKKR